MYEFVSGPLVWISFIVFVGGSFYQLFSMFKLAKRDKIIYPYMSLKFSLRSLIHWIIPFASTNMRKQPEVTVTAFVFHIGVVLMPIFLLPHIMLIERAWGISWWTLPKGVADAFTLLVIFSAIAFFIRRISNPVVKYVTFTSDYVLLAIAAAPFVTGFFAYHHIFPYQYMSLLHMVAGEIMLMAIPFSRLAHMLYFAFTRAYMGSEFGAVRNAKDW